MSSINLQILPQRVLDQLVKKYDGNKNVKFFYARINYPTWRLVNYPEEKF